MPQEECYGHDVSTFIASHTGLHDRCESDFPKINAGQRSPTYREKSNLLTIHINIKI